MNNQAAFARFTLMTIIACLAKSSWADELHVPTQYATVQSAIDAASNGDEIVIAPGTYRELLDTLGKEILVRSTEPDNPSVVASTILSGDLDMDGVGESSVIWAIAGEPVETTFDGLTIRDGRFPAGSAFFIFESSLTIRRCSIIANDATGEGLGGAIACFDGALLVDRCNFSQNTSDNLGADLFLAGVDAQVNSCDFTGSIPFGSSYSYSIYSNNAANNLSITDCTFADSDGAIDFRGDSLQLINTEFRNVSVTAVDVNADSVLMTGCLVTQCGPEHTTRGLNEAVIRVVSSSIVVDQCEFLANTNTKLNVQTGGLLLGGGVALVTDCRFVGNRMSDDRSFGGGLVSGMQETMIDNCEFVSNFAQYGGAIELAYGSSTIRNSRFYDNEANLYGAVFVNRGEADIRDCVFERNRATSYDLDGKGGAVGMEVPDRTILSRCVFIGNVAEDRGGAVSISEWGPARTNLIDRCFFAGCSSGVGGAIWFSQNSHLFTITNSVFNECSAEFAGGAIASEGVIDIIGNTFVNNAAPAGPDHHHTYELAKFVNNAIIGDAVQPRVVYDGEDEVKDSYVGFSIIPGGYTGPGTTASVTDAKIEIAWLPSDGGDGWGDDPATAGVDESANDDRGDISLLPGSIGIDAGDSGSIPTDSLDLDGDGDFTEQIEFDYVGAPRAADDPAIADTGSGPSPIVDIGAVEYVPPRCLADVNNDGVLSPTDFTAWIDAFNQSLPECDQNADALCTPSDFTAWIINYNAGC